MEENLRSLVFEGEALPSCEEAPPTECEVIFTITQLPEALRRNVLKAMVDSANRYLHSLDVYPVPQIDHEVIGLDVPCPNRVYGEVTPYNSARVRQPTTNEERAHEAASRVADTLQGAARTNVVVGGPPETLYVDTVGGRDDGHGTLQSPFKSVRRARMHARQLRRPTYIRNLSGGLLAEVSTNGVAPPPTPRPVPAPTPARQMTRPPVQIINHPNPPRRT